MKTSIEKRKRLFEDIYDLIKGGTFEEEAKKNLRRFIRNKEVSWNGDYNIIKLGKYFKIQLID